MSRETNIKLIREIYDNFKTGNIPAVMERVADNVEWGIAATSSLEVPWHGLRQGKTGAGAFFQALGQNCEFPRFEYGEMIADETQVYAQIHFDVVLKKNGRRASMSGTHYFVVHDGRITRWLGTEDTAHTKALWNA
jgi:ketosteroid isomerase-like protein